MYTLETRVGRISNFSLDLQLITVHVIDINDESPEFTQRLYTAEVYEDADAGSLISRVTATDGDSGRSQIVGGSINFVIAVVAPQALTERSRTYCTIKARLSPSTATQVLSLLGRNWTEKPLIHTP